MGLFEQLNLENYQPQQQQQNVRADMTAVARLGATPTLDLPSHSLDQFVSNDTFPNVSFSDARGGRFSASGGPSSDTTTTRGDSTSTGDSASGDNKGDPTGAKGLLKGMHEMVQKYGAFMTKAHAAAGVTDLSGQPKQGSGCPASAMRSAVGKLFGGGGGGGGNGAPAGA